MKLRAVLENIAYERRIAMWIVDESGEKTGVASLVFEQVEQGSPYEPTLRERDDVMRPLLQSIVDEAAKLGIKADVGERQSMNRHLEDMRRIVFHQLGLDKN